MLKKVYHITRSRSIANTWLPFKMVQGSVKWYICFYDCDGLPQVECDKIQEIYENIKSNFDMASFQQSLKFMCRNVYVWQI
jgi:hypothetical protein